MKLHPDISDYPTFKEGLSKIVQVNSVHAPAMATSVGDITPGLEVSDTLIRRMQSFGVISHRSCRMVAYVDDYFKPYIARKSAIRFTSSLKPRNSSMITLCKLSPRDHLEKGRTTY